MTKYKGKILFMAILVIAFSVSAVQADWEVEQIESVYDDGMMTETGGKFFETPWVEIKSSSIGINSYFAFRGVTIPDNSIITNATLEFTAPFPWNYNQTLLATVYGLKAGDLTSWNPTPDLNSVIGTTNNTVFDIAPLVSSAQINVTVTGIVREIFELYEWESGNDMGFRISSVAVSGGVRYQEAYDSNPNSSLKLYVEYTEGDNSTTYYKGYTITAEATGDIPLLWTNASSDWNLCTYEDSVVIDQSQLGFDLPNDGADGMSRDLGSKIGGEFYTFGEVGGNLTLFKTADTGNTWTQVWTETTLLGNLVHFGFYADDTNDMIHMVYTTGVLGYYQNLSLVTLTTGARYTIKNFPNAVANMMIDMKESTNSLYVGVGTSDVAWAYTRHGGVWAERGIDHGTQAGVCNWIGVDFNAFNDKVVWTVQMSGAGNYIFANVTDASDPATKLDSAIEPHVGWQLMSYSGIIARGHTLITKSNVFYVAYAKDYGGWERLVVDNWGYAMGGAVSHWDQANWTSHNQRYWNMYGDESNSDYPNVAISVSAGASWGMYDMTVDFFQGSRSAVQWGNEHLFTRAGLIFNPHPPRQPFDESSLTVLDPDGNPVNNTCILSAETVEEVMACIDDIVGQTPDDPNPPGTTYPPDGFGEITRFNMRFTLWAVGWVLIITPFFAMAWKTYPMKVYLMFVLMVMLGLGLQWSLGSI